MFWLCRPVHAAAQVEYQIYKINIELLETEISAAFICYIPNRTKPKSLFSPECWLDYQLGGAAAMNGGDS